MFFKSLRADINAAKRNDPAARSKFEIWLTYSGVHALSWHRAAAFFYKIKLKLIARIISQTCRFFTGIEIHPAAKIAPGVFIDHGSGVVIGETAEVGEGSVLYQGCTLGGTGKETGKRHPTVGKYCVISAGAMVLGNITVGDYAKVGGGAVVLKDVPPHATVVGVPARIVRIDGSKEGVDLIQEKEDPYQEDIAYLLDKVAYLEKSLAQLSEECGKPVPEYKGKEEPEDINLKENKE
ncbi:MAG: serine O-acetyltransferase [Clostridia bacterium]|nr:serine O-acetyltransferase [Clostridia bacterium]